ncbi:MAG: Thiamin ABC transporter, transmembrane component [uncultured Thiotrichaceae bacterium]|uniref:Thiamin ABC transporter, transmembrane component n=1 Tax=uncultured Thiotrichaceae bacterium TaxID=298394 RepID=A0A6S6T114_9GAMM|nr:MAG: Thiamin ABC transporter, transmembrane component [uncultured Thiotrichaceae bacterium]
MQKNVRAGLKTGALLRPINRRCMHFFTLPGRLLGVLGYSALLLITLPTIVAFYALIGFGGDGVAWELLSDSYFHAILYFSLKQAVLSAGLSVMLAWPVARALYYLPDLYGRRAFLALCLLCFVLPTLILITGLVALLGRSGWLVPLLGEDWNLYGLHGILLAHIFLNMPFAVRALFLQLQGIPDSSWRLAAQLKITGRQRFALIEWPAIKGRLLVLSGFVFVLCFNSFAVVLALGGGPQATTLEVAIYQSLKYDFNIPEALTLAWVQLLIAGSLFFLMARFGAMAWLSPDTASRSFMPRVPKATRVVLYLVYMLAWCFLLLPLLALMPGLLALDAEKWLGLNVFWPTVTTLVLGITAAALALLLTYLLLWPLRQARINSQLMQMSGRHNSINGYSRLQWSLEWLATHNLVAPAMVLSVGLYVFFLTRINVDQWGIVLVALLNTVVIIPFAVQQMRPRLLQFDDQYQRLCASLKLSTGQRLQIEWPWMKQVLISTFALVLLLAMGDVAIFSIFGNGDWMTLPWLIYSYAGTYRIPEASLAAVILLVVCGLIVMLFERNN